MPLPLLAAGALVGGIAGMAAYNEYVQSQDIDEPTWLTLVKGATGGALLGAGVAGAIPAAGAGAGAAGAGAGAAGAAGAGAGGIGATAAPGDGVMLSGATAAELAAATGSTAAPAIAGLGAAAPAGGLAGLGASSPAMAAGSGVLLPSATAAEAAAATSAPTGIGGLASTAGKFIAANPKKTAMGILMGATALDKGTSGGDGVKTNKGKFVQRDGSWKGETHKDAEGRFSGSVSSYLNDDEDRVGRLGRGFRHFGRPTSYGR